MVVYVFYCQARGELDSAAAMLRQGIDSLPVYMQANEILTNLSVSKCTAVLVDLYADESAGKLKMRTSSVAELRDLRQKTDSKEERLLHATVLKKVENILSGK